MALHSPAASSGVVGSNREEGGREQRGALSVSMFLDVVGARSAAAREKREAALTPVSSGIIRGPSRIGSAAVSEADDLFPTQTLLFHS